ncbi:MAG: hypothetical protein M3Z04_19885 [Chloroflexota bacterium]|nr:hypothetical protein [Chloroflexota bacterium]
MSFNWYEYLDLAYEIAGLPTVPVSDEAHGRAAISRAYYAAHKLAFRTAIGRGRYRPPLPGTGNVHLDLIRHIRTGPTPAHRNVAARLDTLRKMRGVVDYEDQISPFIVQNTAAHLLLAKRLIADLAKLSSW